MNGEKAVMGMTETEKYLAEFYVNLFFGSANKRYRAMTFVEMQKRCKKLNQEMLKNIGKSNELNDVHAMFSKVCAYLMRKETTAPKDQRQEVKNQIKKMKTMMKVSGRKKRNILLQVIHI